PTLVQNDPPEHTLFRNLLNRSFTPRRMALLEPRVREFANNLVDEFPTDGQIEFVSQFATRIPMLVTAEIMGVPFSDFQQFKRWIDDMAPAMLRSAMIGNVPGLPA